MEYLARHISDDEVHLALGILDGLTDRRAHLNVDDVLPQMRGDDDQLGDIFEVARVGDLVHRVVLHVHPRDLVLEEPVSGEGREASFKLHSSNARAVILSPRLVSFYSEAQID